MLTSAHCKHCETVAACLWHLTLMLTIVPLLVLQGTRWR
jgi:hypothetical protein